ncbi:unnamed protein product [Paramecium octaurelia]|uniref:Uncharacterized protein n=1 Tax=Paramecium octaurelia TaxID=43137 RepID=A0A8S1Y7S1_PAROT|nr:unnamed protein product [Paramecium octaurelia]
MDDQFIEEKLSLLHKVENNQQLIYYNALFQSLHRFLQVILQIQQELQQINKDLLIEHQSLIVEGIVEKSFTVKSKIEIDVEAFKIINQALDNMIQSEKLNKIYVRFHRLMNILKFQNITNLFELEKVLSIAIIELTMQQQKDLGGNQFVVR